jgi:hypothetical protein
VPTKTYVLLEHTKPTANVYIQVNKDQRVPIAARRLDMAHLQVGFTDREGNYKTLRLKLNAKSIYQDEQIKAGILANEKFSQKEREAVTFKHGVALVKTDIVQQFLDVTPQNEKFWVPDEKGQVGACDEILQPLFKEYNKDVEVKSTNINFKKRLAAANRINDLTLEEGQALMIRLNGSHFTPPESLEEIQNQLVDWLDITDEAGMDALIRKDHTTDEEATIVVSKAIEGKLISFDKVPGQVVKVKGNNTVTLKEIPQDFNAHDQQRYFIEYLISDAGKLVYQDLKNEVAGESTKKKGK